MAKFKVRETASTLTITGNSRQLIGSALCLLIIWGLGSALRNQEYPPTSEIGIALIIAGFLYFAIGLARRSQVLKIDITEQKIFFRRTGLFGSDRFQIDLQEIEGIRLHTEHLVNGIQHLTLTISHLCGFLYRGKVYDFYSSAFRKETKEMGKKVALLLGCSVEDRLTEIEGTLGSADGNVGGPH